MKRPRKPYRARILPKIAPPENIYLLEPSVAARALGVSKASLARWRVLWKRYNPETDPTPPPGPPPVYITSRTCKYRADECYNFGTTFVDRMRAVTASVGTKPCISTAAVGG